MNDLQTTIAPTYRAEIYCGLRPGYKGIQFPISFIYKICQNYCNEIGLCVTVTPTKFIYHNGSEDGAIIGLINYPRFQLSPEDIKDRAVKIAAILKDKCKQYRISIVCDDQTIMLGDKH